MSTISKYIDLSLIRFQLHVRHGVQELFGPLHIICDLFVIFLLELVKLVFATVFQKFIVGMLTVIGDCILKPLLSSLFNSLLQPLFVMLWNTTTGVRRFVQPMVLLIADILQPITYLVRSFRLIEYRNKTTYLPQYDMKSI